MTTDTDEKDGKPHRLWVRSDDDFRRRIEQISKRIDRPMSQILRDGAERELIDLLANHPKLKGFEFKPIEVAEQVGAAAEA